MKLAFCVNPDDEKLILQDRFGRSPGFALVDSESGDLLKLMDNPYQDATGGAGTAVLQLLIDSGAKEIIAPELGPKALDALLALGLSAWKQKEGSSLNQALADWRIMGLSPIKKAGNKGLHRP